MELVALPFPYVAIIHPPAIELVVEKLLARLATQGVQIWTSAIDAPIVRVTGPVIGIFSVEHDTDPFNQAVFGETDMRFDTRGEFGWRLCKIFDCQREELLTPSVQVRVTTAESQNPSDETLGKVAH